MKFTSTVFSLIFTAALMVACDRNEEIAGCTDHLSENHDPRATVDDGSCTYSEETQLVWKNGEPGGWNGELFTYGIVPTACRGTMIVEADTSDQANKPAVLATDANGNVNVQFNLMNSRSAQNYIEGYVHVDIQRADSMVIPNFEIYVHGKVVDSDHNCGEFIRSEKLQFSALALSDTPTTLSVPFRDFNQLLLGDLNVLFGISLSGAEPNSEVLKINNIRWTRF